MNQRQGEKQPPEVTPDPERVAARLERILARPVFQRSHRLRDFLRFLVEETLAGRQHSIKSYTLVTLVLDRPDDFDGSTDPIVRIYVGRLRRRLSDYCATEGAADPIRITLSRYLAIVQLVENFPDVAEDR